LKRELSQLGTGFCSSLLVTTLSLLDSQFAEVSRCTAVRYAASTEGCGIHELLSEISTVGTKTKL